MPRRKRGAMTPQGRGRGGRGQTQSHNHPTTFVTGSDQLADFTLADEARRTLQESHSWENATLRRMPIEFVSAGFTHKSETSRSLRIDNVSKAARWGDEEENEFSSLTSESTKMSIAIEAEVNIDQNHSSNVQHRDCQYTNRHVTATLEGRSSQDSSSSGEELLFQGRNRTPKQARHQDFSLTAIHAELRVVEEQLPNSPKIHRQPTANMNDSYLGLGKNHRRRKHQVVHMDASRREENVEEDAVFADYIANLRQNGEIPALLQTTGSLTHDDSEDLDKSKNLSDSSTPLKTAPDSPHPENQHISYSPTDSQSEQDESYNQFDIMDWERPSLRRKIPKKSRLPMYFQDSDSELERKLQAAWNKDRFKKSERRKLREELRVSELGMSDKRTGYADLRITYPTGMSLQQVAEELKAFLSRTDEVLVLPPMDTHARKMVHELASKFNVKSKSLGKGDQRRPTLHRKKGTLRFDQAHFDNAFKRIHRKFFPRLDVHDNSRRTAPSQTNQSAVQIRDGEIVGGAAPELGVENRGRTILEKMGWSSGTALGADDNKGILQPVTHTMKRSKAGLG